jgi:hypothetical protein
MRQELSNWSHLFAIYAQNTVCCAAEAAALCVAAAGGVASAVVNAVRNSGHWLCSMLWYQVGCAMQHQFE